MIRIENTTKDIYLSNMVNGYGSEKVKLYYSFGTANGMYNSWSLKNRKSNSFCHTIFDMTNSDIEDGFGESNQFYTRDQNTILY